MANKETVENKLLKAHVYINREDPLEANSIGFGAKALVSACLPYNQPKKESLENGAWIRKNGAYSLWIQGGPKGLPYGTYPRLFVIWLTTQAIKTGNRKIFAGGTIREYLKAVGVDSSRGVRGSGKMMLEQTTKFLESRAAFSRSESNDKFIIEAGNQMLFAEDYELLWDPKKPDQELLFDSYIELSEKFFKEITSYSIPLDMRAVEAIRSSPMALDIYQWLAYRLHYIKPGKPTLPSWDDLRLQFGAEYKRRDHFINQFKKKLKQAMTVYPAARVALNENGNGLILSHSPPPVPKKPVLITK